MKLHSLSTSFALLTALFASHAARAEEGGTGHHLPGSGVFLAGILPEKPGLTVKVADWAYVGSASGSSPLSDILRNAAGNNDGVSSIFSAIKNGGAKVPPILTALANRFAARVQATDVKLTLDTVQNVSVLSLAYEVPWKPLGARFVTGVSLPWVYVRNTATIEIKGPKRSKSASITESAFGFSDMVITPFVLGWHAGDFDWNVGTNIYAPTGSYSPGDLAPLGKNFWTFEPFVAGTYLNRKYGQEASVQIAFDANTENAATSYQSGCQLNIEWLLAQHLPYGFSAGVTGFLYQQVTPDRGAAALGLAGTYSVGPSIGYTWKDKLSVSAQWMYEFEVDNRFKGSVASLVASWTF